MPAKYYSLFVKYIYFGMARFISINEILHRGRFAEKKEQDSKSSIVTDAPIKEELKPVEITETPEAVEPTIQDAPVADTVEVITDTNTEEANVNETDSVKETDHVEEGAAPKKKGGRKTKTAEENN